MAKKITDEDLRLNIIVNGDTARKQILDTKKELDRLVTLQKEQQEAVKQMEKDGTYLVRTTGYEKAKKAVETLSQDML